MSQGMLGALLGLRKSLLHPVRSTFLSSLRSISHEERLYQTDIYLKRNGRVSLEGFQDLQLAPKITPDRALLMFRCCGSLLPDLTPSRRHELMLDLKARFKPPFIDISHFNTQLLVQNENAIPYCPSEALAELQSLGLEPNRVTYQHLIERYALQGDLPAANAILSHMKESGMPVNEWIFGSLISCHCLLGDLEGARRVMDLMKQSGLEVGSEAHISYILGVLKHRAKDMTSQEMGGLFEDAKLKEINFCDHDIFQVLATASSLNRIDLAPEIISYLPKKAGFYQEMRNHIPGLIFNGHLGVALSLFQDFVSNIQQDDSGLSKRVGGDFLPVAMVRSKGIYSSQEIEEAIDNLQCEEGLGYIYAETLAASIEEGDKALSQSLGEIMFRRRLMDRKNFIPYIRRKTRAVKDGNALNEMADILASLVNVGIFPPMQSYSQDILPLIISNRSTMDGRTVNVVRDLLNAVKESTGGRIPPYSDLANACVQYHLNQEKGASLKEALRMLSSIRTEWVLPISWKVSLSKSYLASGCDLEALSGFFFYCLRNTLKTGEVVERNNIIWDTIPLIHSFAPKYNQDKDPDLILKDILSHLSDKQIIPPRDISSTWKRTIEDPSVRQLIDDLETSSSANWSPEEDAELNESIFRNILGKGPDTGFRPSSGASRSAHESLIKSIAEEKYVQGADNILNVLRTSEFVIVPRELHDLVLGLCQSRETDKALEVFRVAMEGNDSSRVYAATASHLLGSLISSRSDSWKSFLLNSVQVDKLITKPGVSVEQYFSRLGLHLDSKKETGLLEEVRSTLIEKGLVGPSFTFSEDSGDRGSYTLHTRVVELIAQKKTEEAMSVLGDYLEKGEVVYGGTCIQMVGALSKEDPGKLLKEFLFLLSEDRVHARQTWNGFLVSLLNHAVDHMEDASAGHALLEDLLEAGKVPSINSKAYYNTKVGLLIKEGEIEKALDLLLKGGEEDVLVKNQEMMKIFAETEDLEKLQKVLDVAIGILGEVNALYSLIRCFLDLGKFPQVKKLLETPGFRYMPSNVENLVEYLIRSDNIGGLEHFVNYSRNLFACDRDYLYSKLLAVTPRGENQGEKASEIWINLQEEGHIPSPQLKAEIANALRASGKYVPFSEETKSVKPKGRESTPPPPTHNSFLKSLSDKKDDPKACIDLVISLEETERSNILSTKQGIKAFAEVLRCSNSDDLSTLENIFSEDLNKLYFISRRKSEALILERKVDLVDFIRENPERVPSVKIISEVADAEGVRRLYDLRDSLTDVGKAVVVASACIKKEFSLVKDFMKSTDREDRSYINLKRYIRGNVESISEPNEFLRSLKEEGLISELGGPVYSYLLEGNYDGSPSKDDLSNLILELSKNRVELNNMSTAALRICVNHVEDKVLKRNMNSVLDSRRKAA